MLFSGFPIPNRKSPPSEIPHHKDLVCSFYVLFIVSFQSSMHITMKSDKVLTHIITEGGQEPKCVAYGQKQHLFTLWYG